MNHFASYVVIIIIMLLGLMSLGSIKALLPLFYEKALLAATSDMIRLGL